LESLDEEDYMVRILVTSTNETFGKERRGSARVSKGDP
jgi:hypothetical protein